MEQVGESSIKPHCWFSKNTPETIT